MSETIGILSKLKGRMRELNMSYQDVGRETGIAKNTLANKLNGKSYFDIDQIRSVSDVLNIDAQDIYQYFLPSSEKDEK